MNKPSSDVKPDVSLEVCILLFSFNRNIQTLPQQSNRGLLQMETTLQDIWEHLFVRS